ncbi:MAG: cytochrome c-type biogenesis protein CcmH [Chloroflexi bacterium]|nr:cytochrome c-type biogenesis protein CcmH [Chloroflexota bacterium]
MTKRSLTFPDSPIPWVTVGVLALLILGLTFVGIALARGNPTASSAVPGMIAPDQRMIRIADQLQCPICEGQSVAFSNSQLATEMRRTIEDKLAAGESDAAIIQYFVDRYGVKILREPPRTGFLAWLWITPVAGFALALLGLLWKLRQMSRRTNDAASDRSTSEARADDEVLDPVLRHLVAQYDKDFLE